MPVSLLNTDTSFPTFESDTPTKERVEVLTNYLYMLLEELRYTFGNLGEENFNDAGLLSLSMKIREPINIRISETENSVAEISAVADENSASISRLLTWQSETDSSITKVEEVASSNEAKITLLTQWQDDVDYNIAQLAIESGDNYAAISQIVSSVGEDGEVTAASIVTAINDAGSSVKISADHVNISGFVTFESLETDGGSTINGNNVSLILDAAEDDGYTDLASNASLNFMYRLYTGTDRFMASLYTTVDGSDTDITSRYALHIDAHSFRNNNNTRVYPAIKMSAGGRISIEGDAGVYVAALGGGYIMMDAADNTRIVAYLAYSEMETLAGSDTYSFCTDGIYYGGTLLIST